MSKTEELNQDFGFSRLSLSIDEETKRVIKTVEICYEDVIIKEGQDNYYIHIDILTGAHSTICAAINSYMLKRDYHDPRRYPIFFNNALGNKSTLKKKREVCDCTPSYYEIWKVKASTFSVKDFFVHFLKYSYTFTIRLMIIRNNEDELFEKSYNTEKIPKPLDQEEGEVQIVEVVQNTLIKEENGKHHSAEEVVQNTLIKEENGKGHSAEEVVENTLIKEE
ncbi:hypothetical protein HDV02_002701 [Globomyces sp. JEL0801]|nr:hypothetical protein HDV02_002701 [Globomyces sp. JEL0801]